MPQPMPPALDILADHLARLEERVEAGEPTAAADATVAGVKAELDTMVAELRQRPSSSSFDQESACRKVIEMVQAIGRSPQEPDRTIDPSQPGESAASAAPVSPPVGMLGVYELLAKLGEGGMGAVYKARHTKLDKIVAIKVLPAERMKDREAVARFEREMRAVGKLEHQNIVRAMDAGEADGRHFLVMEYVPGIDLSQLVKQLGPLPIADACELIRQAAVGLEEARENGMVHRDIKPSNLMLCVVGKKKPPVVKVLDMGLALLSEAYSPEAKGLTTTGQMMGTLDYMAPEQGGDSHVVDIRADIYSLGASLYKLLCGEVVYFGPQYQTPVQKMMALATQAAPPIQQRRQEVPAELAAVLHRMLEKSPSKRYSTPEEVAQALAPFCGGANLAGMLNKVGFDVAPAKDGSASQTARSQPDIDTDATKHPTIVGTAAAPAVRSKVPPAKPREAAPAAAPMPVIQVQPKPQPAKPKEAAASKSPPFSPLLIGGGLFGAGALVGLIALAVFFFDTPEGTLRVEINDPTIEVAVKGSNIVLKKAEKEEITLTPGPHALTVKRGDFTFTTRDFELKKDEVTTVRVQMLPGKVQVAMADGRVLGARPFGKPEPGLPVPGQGTPAGPANPATPLAPALPAGGLDLPAGKFALSFDHGNHVIVPKVPFRQTTVLTIEAWASMEREDLNPNRQAIVDTPNGTLGMLLTGHAFYTFHGGPTTENTIQPKRRVHLASVNNGQKRLLFLNGKLIGQTDDAGSVNPSGADGPLGMGAERFRGVIDAVRISTTARYDKEFTPPAEFKADKETFALYDFKEGRGDVLNDSSGNGYHANIKGAKWVQGGETGQPPAAADTGGSFALQFDEFEKGKNIWDVVEVPTLKDENPSITMELWLGGPHGGEKVVHPQGSILGFGDKDGIRGAEYDGFYAFSGSEPFGTEIKVPLDAPGIKNKALHLAGVRDGEKKECRFYLNGNLMGSYKYETGGGGGVLSMGTGPSGFGGFRGWIDEVRISNVARYQANFTPQRRFDSDKNTLALYHFDEGQGEVLNDSSGNKHHGKIVGAKWVRGGAAAPAGDVAGLRVQIPEGSKRFFAAEVPSLAMPEGPLTLEGYVRIDSPECGGNPQPFGWLYQFAVGCPGGWSKHGWWLQPAGGGVKQSQVVATTGMKVGAWHHLAAIRDTNGVHSFYLDGVLQEKSEPSPAIVKPNPELEDAGKLLLGWICDKMTLREIRVSKVARYSGERFTPTARFEPDADTLGLYHCDEGQGEVLKDSSGNNRHGKIAGGQWVAAFPPFDPLWAKAVAAMPPEEQVKAVVAELKRRNPEYSGVENHLVEGSDIIGFELDGFGVRDLTPLRALAQLRQLALRHHSRDDWKLPVASLAPLAGMKLEWLNAAGTSVTDLSPLRGMPLKKLNVRGLGVTDLAPLGEMQLAELDINGTQVRDLSPLDGQPLIGLVLNDLVSDLAPLRRAKLVRLEAGPVTDLSPLAGQPLEALWVTQAAPDLSPVAKAPLSEVRLDRFDLKRDGPILRAIPTLKTINNQPAAEVLK